MGSAGLGKGIDGLTSGSGFADGTIATAGTGTGTAAGMGLTGSTLAGSTYVSGTSLTSDREIHREQTGDGAIFTHSAWVPRTSTFSPWGNWPTMLKLMPAPARTFTF